MHLRCESVTMPATFKTDPNPKGILRSVRTFCTVNLILNASPSSAPIATVILIRHWRLNKPTGTDAHADKKTPSETFQVPIMLVQTDYGILAIIRADKHNWIILAAHSGAA
jgi:hypothetical protein